MKPKLVLAVLVSFIITFSFSNSSSAQEKLTDTVIKGVVTSAFPDITPGDIKIKMKKKLTSRHKINLEIAGRNAILYLKYKRYRNGARWWFENDPGKSLVYLSKTYKTTRKSRSLYERKTAAQNPGKVEKRRKTIQVQKEVKAKQETAKKAEPAKTVENTKKAQVEPKAEKAVAVAASVEKAKPQEATAVKIEKKIVRVQTKPKPDKKSIEEPAEKRVAVKAPELKPEKKVVERQVVKPLKQVAEPVSTPVIEKKGKKEIIEKPKVAEVPAKIEESEKLEMAPEVEKPVLTPQPELAVEKPEESEDPEVKDTSPEAEQEINQPVPVELATGPEGTSKEFIITLVDYLTEGREGEYRNFLIRPSEMAIEVDERDFNRGVDLWLQQFNNIHESLGEAENVTIRQIILQRARTNEIERATLDALRKRISGVNKVFTYVKVNLLIDGEPAYISIGGLMQTDNGWRIGGRISFTQQLSLQ